MQYILSETVDISRDELTPTLWPTALMVTGNNHAHLWRVTMLDVEDLCCGAPWSAKGIGEGYEVMRRKVRDQVVMRDQLPIITDASSCTQSLAEMVRHWRVPVLDVIEFAADELMAHYLANDQKLKKFVPIIKDSIVYQQVQGPVWQIDYNFVAVFNQGNITAGGSFR